jgi:hypothetical protein
MLRIMSSPRQGLSFVHLAAPLLAGLFACAGEAPVDVDPPRDAGTDTRPLGQDAEVDTNDDSGATDDTGVREESGPLEDTGPETPPDTGLVCSGQESEPNGSVPSGISLKAIDDCDGSGGKFTGVVAGEKDVDFWHYIGTDKALCVVDPAVKTSSPGVKVCVFPQCRSGATKLESCKKGTKESILGGGIEGCCAEAGSEAIADFTCTLVGTSDDADVYMRVTAPAATACVPYEVSYHF